jgi:hypothetical protein
MVAIGSGQRIRAAELWGKKYVLKNKSLKISDFR